jgi:hypothetical protein
MNTMLGYDVHDVIASFVVVGSVCPKNRACTHTVVAAGTFFLDGVD